LSKSIPDIFKAFNDLQVLIIGDVMLDSYIWGAVERVSPEAPVPIVSVRKRDVRLGGAANVALNVQALGAKPILCALIGDDDAGRKLIQNLNERGISKEGIVTSAERPTTVKTRVIASHQHVVRVDEESDALASVSEEKKLLEKIEKLLPACQVVIFEDYDKPNLKELREGLKIDVNAGDQHQVASSVESLKAKLQAKGILVTLSEHGAYIDFENQKIKLPAHKREIADVSGAGDTVVSIAAVCVALKLDPKLIVSLSNLGGGLVCQHVGVVPIDREEFLREALHLK
jgi:bifunctional ADP-heptose synthase (sugar kinase/adenylyltransferase)